MKRLILSVLCLCLLITLFPVSARAASAPVINSNPSSASWPEGSTAIWECEASDGSSEFYGYHWYIVYNGTTYDTIASDASSQPWHAFGDEETGFGIGPMENQFIITGIQSGLNGAEIFCVAENEYGKSESVHAKIMVGSSTMYKPAWNRELPAYISCEQGETVTLKTNASSTDEAAGSEAALSLIWYESYSEGLEGCIAINRGAETGQTLTLNTANMDPGYHFYYCGYFIGMGSARENASYSGCCAVYVREKVYTASISIETLPKKLVYNEGEYVDLAGMKLRIWTNMGFRDTTDMGQVSADPAKLTGSGKKTVTVTYDGCKTTFEVEVKAKTPEKPVIDANPQGGTYKMGIDFPTLAVNAHAPDDGKLYYSWCYSNDGSMEGLHHIDGTDSASYTPPQEEGTKYYCVAIWNRKDDLESEPVYSKMAEVKFEVVPPGLPLIDQQPEGGTFTMGDKSPMLSVKAHSKDGGSLKYIWYYCTDGRMESIRAIDDTNLSVFTPPQEEGLKYYCVGIWNVKDGLESDPVYSDLIRISYLAPVTEPEKPETDKEEEPEKEEPEKKPAKQEKEEKEEKKEKEKETREPVKYNDTVSGWVWAFVIVAVLLAAAVTALVVVLIKRRDSADEEEDEDDEDDEEDE